MPLLAVLLLSTAAAPRSEQDAAREARAAIDRADPNALAIIEEALKRFATRDSEAVWELRVMRGEALMQTSLDAAEKALQFELPSKYSRSATAVQLLMMRALANPNRYTLEAAEDLADAHQRPLRSDVYMYKATLSSDPAQGLKHASEAKRLAQKHGRRIVEAKARTNLAFHLGRLQRYPDAVLEGERAVGLATTLHLPRVRQAAEGNLGWAYFELGHFDTAEELFRSAEKTAREIGANRDRIPWLVQLGNIEFQKRNWRTAADYNAQAATLAPAARRPEQIGYAFTNLALIAIEEGRWADAARFNAQALNVKRENGIEAAVLRSKVVEARLALLTGNRERAEKMFEEVLQQKATAFDTRIEAEGYLATLFANTARHGQARAHFDRAVRAVHEGHDRITDPDLRLAFYNRTSDMFDAYVDFVAQHGTADEALAVMEASRAQSLKDGDAPRRATPTAIAKENKATVLYYWLGRRGSYVWAITPGGVTKHVLPPDTVIEKAAKAYLTDALGGRPETSIARGKELFRMLVPVRLPKDSRVIIIADGLLHTLPFDTLVTPEGRYWIEDATLISAPTLQRAVPGAKRDTPSMSMLVVGDAPQVDSAFPRLKHAQSEIDKVAAHFPRPTILRREQATPAAYLVESQKPYAFIHLAAHGVATRKRPLDSAVILASDKDNSYRLFARDIVEQPLDARLVTISSCHGAGARTYTGEGVVGLAWAFLKAGADQVIAALWEVNDAATPALMDTMYAEIRKGRDPAEALRIAKLQMVRSKGVHGNPRYWAPFVLYSGM